MVKRKKVLIISCLVAFILLAFSCIAILPFKNRNILSVSAASQPSWFRYQEHFEKYSGYVTNTNIWYNGNTTIVYVNFLRFDDKSNFEFNNNFPVYAYDCRSDQVLEHLLGYYNYDNGVYFTYDNGVCNECWNELGLVIYNGAGDIYIAGNAFYNYGAGYNDAEGSAYDVGYNAGVDAGYSQGYDVGVNDGYHNGYGVGVNDSNQYTFYNLFGAVLDAPVKVFSDLFNFELLGVNLLGLITGLFTLAVVIVIIKKVMGGK